LNPLLVRRLSRRTKKIESLSPVSVKQYMDALARRSNMSVDEVSQLMSSDAGLELLGLNREAPTADATALTHRRWESVHRASPIPLTDEQYLLFLQGKDPHG
jgi:hypothetical protein